MVPNETRVVDSIEAILELPSDALAVKGVGLGDAEVSKLLSNCALLEELDLSGCEDVTDRSITDLRRTRLLEKLDLSFCNQITDASLVALSELRHLRFLNLNWCYGITDVGLRSIGRCHTLESVSLWSCEAVTDAGVEALARLPHLRLLELPEFAAITDKALLSLSETTRGLEYLRLDHLVEISGKGLLYLRTLKGLRVLAVRSCPRITTEAVATLQSALPGCEIRLEI